MTPDVETLQDIQADNAGRFLVVVPDFSHPQPISGITTLDYLVPIQMRMTENACINF